MQSSTTTTPQGAVAAGHPATVDAAVEILADGGNAFDAALAALCAACVAEPVLASLGGGGFLTARTAEGETTVFDFFAHTPRVRRAAPDTDFYPIVADFGTTTQEFHIGKGAMAVPGTVAGLFRAHDALGRVPMTRLVEPAIALARDGVAINWFQAFIFDVVEAIYQSTDACRQQFASPSEPGKLVREGDRHRVPDMADAFETLAREGARLFYEGEIAQRIATDCREGGGLLTRQDLADYQVFQRAPLVVTHRGARLATNPPPSSGGMLIAFGLEMLRDAALRASGFGGPEHLRALVEAMAATDAVRRDCPLQDWLDADSGSRVLSPTLLDRYRATVSAHPPSHRGTTHISVIDRSGNACAVTVSNGEGAGYIIPATGIVMNNMLGEEDINPHGFHQWPENKRMSSMMAPSILTMDDGRLVALGSGGSNRIRTALLQVLVNLVDLGLPLDKAISHPRIHLEKDKLGIEPGFAAMEEAIDAAGRHVDVHHWPDLNLFFGGVHGVSLDPARGVMAAAGDPRRGGVGHIA